MKQCVRYLSAYSTRCTLFIRRNLTSIGSFPFAITEVTVAMSFCFLPLPLPLSLLLTAHSIHPDGTVATVAHIATGHNGEIHETIGVSLQAHLLNHTHVHISTHARIYWECHCVAHMYVCTHVQVQHDIRIRIYISCCMLWKAHPRVSVHVCPVLHLWIIIHGLLGMSNLHSGAMQICLHDYQIILEWPTMFDCLNNTFVDFA